MAMEYETGQEVRLGDKVAVNIGPGRDEPARVVMLGETYEHLSIDSRFLEWVEMDRVLEKADIVVEWLGGNPFEEHDPNHAPVGNYMFTCLGSAVTFLERGGN